MTINGGCLCGLIRYSTEAEPLYAGFCHCRDCMKATGSGFGAFMGFSPADVAMTGETTRFTKIGGSGGPTARYFCPDCGSTVYGDGGEANADAISLSMSARSTIPSSSIRKRLSSCAAGRHGRASGATCRNTTRWCCTSRRGFYSLASPIGTTTKRRLDPSKSNG